MKESCTYSREYNWSKLSRRKEKSGLSKWKRAIIIGTVGIILAFTMACSPATTNPTSVVSKERTFIPIPIKPDPRITRDCNKNITPNPTLPPGPIDINITIEKHLPSGEEKVAVRPSTPTLGSDWHVVFEYIDKPSSVEEVTAINGSTLLFPGDRVCANGFYAKLSTDQSQLIPTTNLTTVGFTIPYFQ